MTSLAQKDDDNAVSSQEPIDWLTHETAAHKEQTHILLMNLSLFTGRPFLPFCTGVSVHISFCWRRISISSESCVQLHHAMNVLTTFSRILSNVSKPPVKPLKRVNTHMLQWRSKALTLASLNHHHKSAISPQNTTQPIPPDQIQLTACDSTEC
jgi:hypothetical protein